MRASNSSVAPRVRARESATAPAGSAAISRSAFRPSVSTSSGATTMLAMPNSLACVALSGCPITRNSNARRWPIRRGASRLEAASGIRPRLTNGVEKNASEPATTKSQWNSMVVPTPTATPLTAATIGLLQRTSAGRKRSAGRERPRHARHQHATDGIIRVRALERSRHRLVHGERERVLLVGPVHPDGADAIGIGDDHMLCHQVYPIPSTSTATGVSVTVVARQMGHKEPRSPTEQGRLPPSRLKSPRPIGRSQPYASPAACGQPIDRVAYGALLCPRNL